MKLSDTTLRLEDLLDTVHNTRADYERKKWRVQIGVNKEVVILQDIFCKIAVWIQKFVEVGDVAMQYDPGHAALPWAAVRFLLIASTSSLEKTKVVLQGIEQICNLITWCNIQEQLHLRHHQDTATPLQLALKKLYGAILKFLAKAVRFYKKNGGGRLFFIGKNLSQSI